MLLKDDDDIPTDTATVAVVTQGTSRGEEQTGNTHNDNSTQSIIMGFLQSDKEHC
jgi:hypothetical protein